MSEQLNGNKLLAWQYFRQLVAQALLSRGLVKTLREGLDFANDLDWSFEQLYSTLPRDKWHQQIRKDCEEYANDPNRGKDE